MAIQSMAGGDPELALGLDLLVQDAGLCIEEVRGDRRFAAR